MPKITDTIPYLLKLSNNLTSPVFETLYISDKS